LNCRRKAVKLKNCFDNRSRKRRSFCKLKSKMMSASCSLIRSIVISAGIRRTIGISRKKWQRLRAKLTRSGMSIGNKWKTVEC